MLHTTAYIKTERVQKTQTEKDEDVLVNHNERAEDCSISRSEEEAGDTELSETVRKELLLQLPLVKRFSFLLQN